MSSNLIRKCGLVAALFLLAGCLNPQMTQMPSLGFRPTEIEKRSFAQHDPYPDDLSGPSTKNRPRAFIDQRTEERRAWEQRMLQGQGIPHGTAAPRLPTSQYQYPNALRN